MILICVTCQTNSVLAADKQCEIKNSDFCEESQQTEEAKSKKEMSSTKNSWMFWGSNYKFFKQFVCFQNDVSPI